MFLNENIQYCKDQISSEINPYIQYNYIQNLSGVFYFYFVSTFNFICLFVVCFLETWSSPECPPTLSPPVLAS
jgi:hypothetical protein